MTSVAFFGSHPLGETCLARLHDHPDVDVDLVVTYPRDHDGWWDGSVHERALEYGYEVATLDEERRVLEHEIDYLLSVYYPNILDGELLDHPERLALNLHQAELPRYRGSNVFSHSILNARADDHWRHGTTLHVMVEDVDAGAVIGRNFAPITEEDTARSLYEKVCEASVDLFEEYLPHIVSGEIDDMGTPQDEFDGPRYFHAKDSLVDRKEIPAKRLVSHDPVVRQDTYDLIRALDFPPFEPAYTTLDGNRIRLTASWLDHD
ncbi:methionyl-tRNA formyltransferase [Halomarina salina]|uniref:Methionyl-tRNA formyltransferase n=1 Tax=Halomarina salina TaxID=1872699 RepID=A0ABD5RU57_9EURY|nr:formyltransferase family protein [Halomarina salina]